MKKVNDIRTGRHCVFLLHAHLVFVTKYRYGVFTKTILDDLKEIFASVCRNFEAELVEFDGEDDHVHLLVVSSKSSHFVFGQQPERRIQQADPQERLSFDPEKTLGRLSLVAKLFCRKLRRNSHLCSAAVY